MRRPRIFQGCSSFGAVPRMPLGGRPIGPLLSSATFAPPLFLLVKVAVAADALLGIVDLAVDGIGLQEILRRVKAVDPPVVHDDDPVAVLHRGDALRDDELCRIRDLLPERLADLCVCRRVHGTGRVIQNQNLRLLQERSGDAESLLLTAGDVGSALADHRVVAVRHLLDELRGAGQVAGAPAFPVSGNG